MLRDSLASRWEGLSEPFLVGPSKSLNFSDIETSDVSHLRNIKAGDVVALIGDFDARSITDLLTLIDKRAVVVPLTNDTESQHPYFFDAAQVDWVVHDGQVRRLDHQSSHHLLDTLRSKATAGLVLFSTGTTGRPKAILHDFSNFLRRYEVPRPSYRTLAFLLFDHIGGINTLFHTLFNRGTVIAAEDRSISSILRVCEAHKVEVLPTTPTFLRMLLLSGYLPHRIPPSLKVITYGTERMDQGTLDSLCDLLPSVDFRQTFGMSELGILRVKSESRRSLFMRIGGDGVATRVVDDRLEILAPNRMLGYLNADSPFDHEGWYNTNDLVVQRDGFIQVVGRTSEVINVGGLKFMASDVERIAMAIDGVSMAVAQPRPNPITGEHVELRCELSVSSTLTEQDIRSILKTQLPEHMQPRRIRISTVRVNHRFKKMGI